MDRRPEPPRRRALARASAPPTTDTRRPAPETVRELAPALGPELAGVGVAAGPGAGLPPRRPAAALGDELRFGSAMPPAALVAHELVHAAQAIRFGPAPPGAAAGPDAADEREAGSLAPALLRGEPVTVTQAPTAPVRFWEAYEDVERPGVLELRDAVSRLQADRAVDILAANREPAQMAALRFEYGPRFVRDLHWVLSAGKTKTLWSLARVYLGDQLSLDERIDVENRVFGGDRDQILAQIEAISDEQALRIVTSETQFPGLLDTPPPGVAPAQASMPNVEIALHDALDADSYYQAMSLLLRKASKASAQTWIAGGPLATAEPTLKLPLVLTPGAAGPPAGGQPGVWVLPPVLEDILAEPPASDAPGTVIGPDDLVFMPLLFDAVSVKRVELAIEQVARADEHTEGFIFNDPAPMLGSAMLALGVLGYTERRAAWARLQERHWAGFSAEQVEKLRRLALFPDDALVLERAAIEANRDPYAYEGQMAVAAATAESMLDEASRGAAASKDPAVQARYETELAHRQTVFSSLAFQTAIGAYEDYAGQLSALGAGPDRIARQALRRVDTADALFGLVNGLPAKDRLSQSFQDKVRYKADELGFNADQLEVLDAYLNLARDDKAGTNFNRVALREVVSAFDDDAPHRALGLLHRMTPEQRDRFVAWAPYQTWYRGLIWRGDKGGWMYLFLTDANEGRTVDAIRKAALWVPWFAPTAKPRLFKVGAYEELLAAGGESQADRRRGYVLWTELQSDPNLELTEADRKLVDAYAEHRRLVEDLGWQERERVDEVFFGQPQLFSGPQGAVDPTTEADYMFARLAARVKLRGSSWRTVTDDVRQWRGDYLGPAVTEFLLTYGELRAGGVDRAGLATLVDLYHRAMHETDEIKHERDLAGIIASIVGCVVAIGIVMLLSGGTLGPVAIGAIAALAGGTAAATAGALIRRESTGLEVLRDFGTGAIEGAMAVAGQALAARVVRALTVGTAAVEAGAAAETAVQLSTGAKVAAHIAGAVVDGAAGGAAGEVFRTATDEATWDRGVSEALSRVLAALGRGALTGAAGGFVFAGGIAALGGLAKVAKRFGQAVALRVADLVETAGMRLQRLDDLSDEAAQALIRADQLAAAGNVDGALAELRKVTNKAGGLAADEAAKLEDVLRAVRVAEGSLEHGLDRVEVLRRIEVVNEAEFARRARGARGNAVIEFHPPDDLRVVVKAGTDPLVVKEEIVHLKQWVGDPLMRARMRRVGGQTAESWAQLGTAERAGLLLDKLEIEADAQRRLIANLEQRAAAGEAEAADQIAAAEDTLRAIGKRSDEVGERLAAGRLDDLDLKEPPQLFSKERATRPADPPRRPTGGASSGPACWTRTRTRSPRSWRTWATSWNATPPAGSGRSGSRPTPRARASTPSSPWRRPRRARGWPPAGGGSASRSARPTPPAASGACAGTWHAWRARSPAASCRGTSSRRPARRWPPSTHGSCRSWRAASPPAPCRRRAPGCWPSGAT
ncbi:MAG TPA: hypothetical protein VGM21_13555 [Actinomycetota bacterium]|jgi:hypothetical protein